MPETSSTAINTLLDQRQKMRSVLIKRNEVEFGSIYEAPHTQRMLKDDEVYKTLISILG